MIERFVPLCAYSPADIFPRSLLSYSTHALLESDKTLRQFQVVPANLGKKGIPWSLHYNTVILISAARFFAGRMSLFNYSSALYSAVEATVYSPQATQRRFEPLATLQRRLPLCTCPLPGLVWPKDKRQSAAVCGSLTPDISSLVAMATHPDPGHSPLALSQLKRVHQGPP